MRRLPPLALFLMLVLPLFCQDSPANPTRLRVATKGTAIVLSWEAPADAPGGWGIYRSAEALGASNLSAAQLVKVAAPSDRSASLEAPDGKGYFYALLALDKAGNPSAAFLPGKTVTAVAIKPETAPTATPTAQPSVALSSHPSETVSNLSVTAGSDSIKLGFSIAAEAGTMLVYRSPSPFTDSRSLLEATLIASVSSTTREFIDFPVPGVDYYYALLPELALKSGSVEFVTGRNVSPAKTRIAAKSLYGALPETGDQSRITPLPSFVEGWPADAIGTRRPRSLSVETEKALATILAPYPVPKPKAPSPALLPEDRGQARGGEDYALSLILQGPFKKGDWAETMKQLRDYLSLNRSPSVASRAHFYLGIALAQSSQPRDAFFEFLQARSLHQTETRPWIQYLVALMRGGQA